MTGYVRLHDDIQSHLQHIGQSSSFEGYICSLQWWSLQHDGDTSNQWAIGLGQGKCRCKYGGGYGIKGDGGFRNGYSGGYGNWG